MRTVHIRFYEELNDLLPPWMRKTEVAHDFEGDRSVKDFVESLGVPHTEVDLILVNGQSVDFGHLLRDGDRVSIYPVFESMAIGGVTRLRPAPLRNPRFACDVHLWKLARRLRLLGFDTWFEPGAGPARVTEAAVAQGRVLLSCSRRILMQRVVTRGILVRHADGDEQARQVVERLDLWKECRPFSRCTLCNGLMHRLDDETVAAFAKAGRIPERVRAWRHRFWECPDCGQLYWEGTHHARLLQKIAAILSDPPG